MRYSPDGDATLNALDGADRFTDWMFEQVRPWLGGSILEIGSGKGTYGRKVRRHFPLSRVILSDIDPGYVAELRREFPGSEVQALRIDMEEPADFRQVVPPVDSAFALNVLEHTRDDGRALRNVYEVLRPGGRLVVLVPAHPFLYGAIDRSIGHTRRYTKKTLLAAVGTTSFTVRRTFYFNALSLVGWYVAGRVLKRTSVSAGPVNAYVRLIPVMRFVEKRILRQKVGMSLIAVLQK
ncbi:MAG: class I SAM-dependent methyltransferase [Candidatus Aminicenantes bacterium]|nr:class I SAM-dependent methyltransferase [Candidatus Aminicenantes bacterium]